MHPPVFTYTGLNEDALTPYNESEFIAVDF